ncbi:MAG: hypothetical protein IID45_14060, partial [Planctomycetes bacterium]|nr:hypothetical protein [Planctomycetota bacterium]
DKTPPSLQLLPILQGTGSNANRFKIRWKSADANPSDRPISIAYSANPNGPWHTISGRLNSIGHSANPNEPRRTISDWIANKGNHLWTVNADVPPHVYIQLTARDQAGNLSSVRTSRPVIVDLVKPSAEIIGVNRSKNGSPRR